MVNAIRGLYELEQQRHEVMRNIVFGASRFNASATAFSKDQSKAIGKHRFPWEKGAKEKKDKFKPMKYSDFEKIAKVVGRNG